ncbi:aspartate aminotransferase family protein [Paenibacillus algorifonticola]|uniref:pyridoxal phosphate-dependent decarboxylase family protein n=1 Tax=Paenibacillus algorifonticola TaxID=684063 RepID=UPI003D28DE6C
MTNKAPKFTDQLDTIFLTPAASSRTQYLYSMEQANEQILSRFACQDKPYSGQSPRVLKQLVHDRLKLFADDGEDIASILNQVGELVMQHSVNVSHPACLAHLQCPPFISSMAAEAIINAMNQSMDSWDQSPAATFVEEQMIAWLCREFGYRKEADGVFTGGGTMSNFMGLLLARDHFAAKRWGWNVQEKGLPPEASKMRIFCSKAAHFTIVKSCALLGLGEQAVIALDVDDNGNISVDRLEEAIKHTTSEGMFPFAVVATAGTTDFGCIDPLEDIAALAEQNQLWFHVDAAYGGALVLSRKHRARLLGIEKADSITVDFHKMFYQSISCGAFLLNERSHFNLLKIHADYLNPEEDEEAGVPNLVLKSVQTTRRFDAMKLYVSLKATGLRTMGEIVDYTLELAEQTASIIAKHPSLQLINQPILNTVVFRYQTQLGKNEMEDSINLEIRDILLQKGDVVLARTRFKGRNCLKFTLLNPRTTIEDIKSILKQVQSIGQHLEQMLDERSEKVRHE